MCSFHLHFPYLSEVEHIFMCLIVVCNFLWIVCPYIYYWVIDLFLIIYRRSSLYIVEINLCSVIWVINILSSLYFDFACGNCCHRKFFFNVVEFLDLFLFGFWILNHFKRPSPLWDMLCFLLVLLWIHFFFLHLYLWTFPCVKYEVWIQCYFCANMATQLYLCYLWNNLSFLHWFKMPCL